MSFQKEPYDIIFFSRICVFKLFIAWSSKPDKTINITGINSSLLSEWWGWNASIANLLATLPSQGDKIINFDAIAVVKSNATVPNSNKILQNTWLMISILLTLNSLISLFITWLAVRSLIYALKKGSESTQNESCNFSSCYFLSMSNLSLFAYSSL